MRHPTPITSNPDRDHRTVDPETDPTTTHDHRKTRHHVTGHDSTTVNPPSTSHLLTRTHLSSTLTILDLFFAASVRVTEPHSTHTD